MKENNMTIESLFAELDGGVFEAKLIAALKETALRVVSTGKKGKITIELGISRISESHQVTIASKLKSDTPKSKGRIIEEDETETPMHVNSKGELSVFHNEQLDFVKMLNEQES